MRSKAMIVLIAGAVAMFVVLGFLTWEAKYGRGRTVDAVAAIDTIVLHQRVMGHGVRGAVAQDRLVSIDGRTGFEYARITVMRGQLVGTHDEKVIYAIGDRLVMYDARTLESSPAPEGTSMPTRPSFGSAMIDLGDGLLLLDADAATHRARASRLDKRNHIELWSTELPWNGHDTKLVVQLGGNVVIVDADATAAVGLTRGGLAWAR